MNDRILIYTTNKIYEANIIKAMLKEFNIEVYEVNKQDSMYLFGDIELYVVPENVEKSLEIIKKDYSE